MGVPSTKGFHQSELERDKNKYGTRPRFVNTCMWTIVILA
jgi:hypothetical protein